MTPPPINIDGTNKNFSNVTIDGQDVTQITIDGQDVTGPIPLQTLQHHYQANNVGLSDGQVINTWTDDVGSSDLTLNTGTPTFETNVVNGLPVLRSNGNEFLDASIPTISQPWTVFCVVKVNTISDDHVFWAGSSTDFNVSLMLNDFFPAFRARTGGSPFNSSSSGNTKFNVFTLIGDGSNSELRLNGSFSQSGSGSSSLDKLTVMSGNNGSNASNGSDFAELIVYSSRLSGQDLSDTENFLLNKYNL